MSTLLSIRERRETVASALPRCRLTTPPMPPVGRAGRPALLTSHLLGVCRFASVLLAGPNATATAVGFAKSALASDRARRRAESAAWCPWRKVARALQG